MPPLRLTLADLSAVERLLLRAADPGTTHPGPAAGAAAADRAAPVQSAGGRAKGRGSRFRLRQPEPSEAIVLRAVLKALAYHPKVAWQERLNSGAGQLAFSDGSRSQWIRFAWRGAPDVIGQLTDGRLLAIEVKAPSGRVRPEQQAFLDTVRKWGGCAFVARSVDDVVRGLG